MPFKFFVVFALAITLAASVQAACNERCRQLCQQNPGAQSVADCIRLWSCINEKYGAAAAKFQNALPPKECKHLFKPKY